MRRSHAALEKPGAAALDGWLIAAIVLAVVHGIAAVFFVGEWVIGTARLRRLVRSAADASPAVIEMWDAISSGDGRRVRLLVSTEITTPLTFGWRRPVVVLPLPMEQAGGRPLRYCLAHEWSHVERADIVIWHALWLCQFLFWHQPLFWTLRRELRICQDVLADEAATRGGKDAVEYSELLVGFARQRLSSPHAGALTFLDHPSQLVRRVKMLLQRPWTLRRTCTWKFSLAAGLVILVASALLSGVRLDAAPAGEAGESQKPPATPAEKPSAEARPAEPKEKPAEAKDTPAASEPPARLTYDCSVVDKATGKGIPNAIVVVRRSNLTPRENPIIEESRHTTDAEGKYSFQIPPEQAAMRYLYIELDVDHESYAARKGFGYALSMIRKNETLGERPFFERVELEAADSVTGKLLSPDGQPLAGVKLLGYSKRSASDFRDYGSFTDTVSKPDGTFRLNLVKGGPGVYWILPKDFAIVQKYVGSQRADQGEIRLQPGIRLAGRVLSVEGKPLEGVAVNINSQDRDDLGGLNVATSVRRGAVSDSEGRFTFDPLPAGSYRVIPEEHLSGALERDRTVYPVPGVFLPKRVSLKEDVPATTLEVQAVPHVVFNAQHYNSNGKKTSGHAIHVSGRIDQDYWFGQGRPDPEGTIALRIPHGLQNVQVNLMTNEHGALRYRRGPDKPLENRQDRVDFGTLNDDVEGFEIVRYRAPIVLVKPVDEAGQPIAGAKVTAAYPWGKQRYILEGEARSDVTFERQKDGRFRSEQLLPDEDVTFTASAEGYESASEKLKLPEGETKDLVLTLKKPAETKQEEEIKQSPPAEEKVEKPAEASQAPVKASPEDVPAYEQPAHLTYRCMVVDKNTGQVVPNAKVTVERSDSSIRPWPFKQIAKTTHVTDARGQYTVEIPPEQSGIRTLYIQIYAEHDNYVRYFGGYSLAMIRKNETVGERPFFERLKLQPADHITGKVVSPSGEPLAGVKVFGFTAMKASDFNNRGWLDAKTQADGSFRVNMIKAGVAFLWIMPNDYSIVQRFASQQSTDLGEIRMPEGIRLKGRAISAEGKPIAGIAVNAYYQGKDNEALEGYSVLSGIRRGAITDADGRFTFDPLPPGEYRVVPEDQLSDPRHERGVQPLPAVFIAQKTTLKEGAVAELELQAVPHVNFHAQYLDSQGKKSRGSEFFISGRLDSQFWSARARPDKDGAIAVRLPHGLQEVQLAIPTNEHRALAASQGSREAY